MAVIGNNRCFYITDAKGSGTFTWIAGEQNNSFSRSMDAIEVSDKQTKWREFLAGRRSATASVTCNLDDSASTSQRAMLKAFHDGQKIFCFVGELADGKTPTNGTAFEAIITSCNDDNSQDSVSTRSFDLQVTGEVVEYPTLS